MAKQKKNIVSPKLLKYFRNEFNSLSENSKGDIELAKQSFRWTSITIIGINIALFIASVTFMVMSYNIADNRVNSIVENLNSETDSAIKINNRKVQLAIAQLKNEFEIDKQELLNTVKTEFRNEINRPKIESIIDRYYTRSIENIVAKEIAKYKPDTTKVIFKEY